VSGKPLLLSYAGCSTCKKALRWLAERGIDVTVRPIVEQGPTSSELARWIPASGLSIQKWLNTSGLSYRALGKERIEAADEATISRWLAADGKLVKRPVLVDGDAVLVGFREDEYAAHFGR
jgi:arsenate reductase